MCCDTISVLVSSPVQFFGAKSGLEGVSPYRGNKLQPFASGISAFQIMPEFDVLFIFFPAQKNLATIAQGGEIQQAAAKVFDLDLSPAKFLQRLLTFRQGLNRLIDKLAAGVIANGQHGGDDLIQGLKKFLARFQLPEPLPH